MKLAKGFLLETMEGNEGIILTKQGVFQRVRLDTYSAIGEEVYGSVINAGNKIKGSLLIGLFFVFFILTQAFFNPGVTIGAGSNFPQPHSKVVEDRKEEESLISNTSTMLFLENKEKTRYQNLFSSRLTTIKDSETKKSENTLKTTVVQKKTKDMKDLKTIKEKKEHWKETGKKPGNRGKVKKEKKGKKGKRDE